MDTNLPPMSVSNPPVVMPPVETNPPVAVPPVAAEPVAPAAGSVYTIVKGDTLGKIAKANGVKLRALQDANPGVDSTKLKIGQKINIPAGGSTSANGLAAPSGMVSDAGTTYTVKSGDTLTRIARAHGTTVRAIKSANNLTTTAIKVGQKLKIPSKAEPVAAPAPAPVDTTPPPALPSTTAPAPVQ
jgi:LysM repeat protein